MPTRAFGGIKIQVSVCGVGIWWSILSFVAKGCWDGRLPKAWKIAHLFFCEEKFQINIDFIYLFIWWEFGVPNCIPYGSFMFSPSAQQSLIMFPICSPRSPIATYFITYIYVLPKVFLFSCKLFT